MAGKANQPIIRRLIIQSYTLLGLVHLIYLLVQIAVAKGAIIVMIECTKGKAELVRYLGVIRYLRAKIVISAITQANTSVLVLQWVTSTDVNNTTDGISTIQCALRTT